MATGPWREVFIAVLALGLAGRLALEGGRLGGAIKPDRETRALVAIVSPWGLAALVWLAAPGWLAWAQWPLPDWLGAVGALFGVLFMWLGWVAHKTLGKSFARVLRIREGHTLITTGPFARIRHPVYAAGFFLVVATALLTGNWLVALASLPVVAAFHARMGREDAMMEEAFGDEWRAWAAHTGRVLPPWPGRRPGKA